MTVQGTAADLMKMLLVEVHHAIKPYNARLLLTVHDEVLIEAPEQFGNQVVAMVQYLVSTQNIGVPLIIEGGVAASWGDAKP